VNSQVTNPEHVAQEEQLFVILLLRLLARRSGVREIFVEDAG
jgi:hypothetical protein